MRNILFSFPVHPIRSRPEGHSQPPRTLPKKRAVWWCHMLRGPLLSLRCSGTKLAPTLAGAKTACACQPAPRLPPAGKRNQ
eukprot:scaffold90154_cov56-Phaeocystis_antarctica.AAC.1